MTLPSRERLGQLIASVPWVPQPGPQLEAYLSPADELLFGGAAAGGKSDLLIGVALTQARRSLLVRREGVQLQPIIARIAQILGSTDGLNQTTGVWRLPGGRTLQLGGVQHDFDSLKYQGAERDTLLVDEASSIPESEITLLLGWVRTTTPGQRTRAIFASNPPLGGGEGSWLVRRWAPWIDRTHPLFPTPPGTVRWVVQVPGEEVERWVESGAPVVVNGRTLRPISRAFIPSRIASNRYFSDGEYERRLASLPEPARSRLLLGDWFAGESDADWQVIPSAWIRAAQERWVPMADPGEPVSVGVDPARTSDAATVAVRREGWRFDEVVVVKPDATGVVTAGAITKRVLDLAGPSCAIHIDTCGLGAGTWDFVEAFAGGRAVAVNAASASSARDVSGQLTYANKRAELWWSFRDMLRPDSPRKVALPRSQALFAELSAPTYRLTARGVVVEDKAAVKRRLGRSTDAADAVLLAACRTSLVRDLRTGRVLRPGGPR